MNNYEDFKKDSFNTTLATTMVIDLNTDDGKIIYIIFRPTNNEDGEHSLLAEVYTAYKNTGSLAPQFDLFCNNGDEYAIREMVIGNYYNDNLIWQYQ